MTHKIFGKHQHGRGTAGVSLLGVGLKKRVAKMDPAVVMEVDRETKPQRGRKLTLRKGKLDE